MFVFLLFLFVGGGFRVGRFGPVGRRRPSARRPGLRVGSASCLSSRRCGSCPGVRGRVRGRGYSSFRRVRLSSSCPAPCRWRWPGPVRGRWRRGSRRGRGGAGSRACSRPGRGRVGLLRQCSFRRLSSPVRPGACLSADRWVGGLSFRRCIVFGSRSFIHLSVGASDHLRSAEPVFSERRRK